MTDMRDDAPPATAKHGSGADHAGDLALEPKGDSLISRSVTINRPRSELYRFWRDFSQLPTFMDNIVRVDVTGNRTSHWVVAAPGGSTVEWDAEITQDIEDEAIAWASTDGAGVANSGRIEFLDAGARGTVVTATILYNPPGGIVGKAVAKLFQREPAVQARRDLRRFKQLMETGEVATNAVNRQQHEEEIA